MLFPIALMSSDEDEEPMYLVHGGKLVRVDLDSDGGLPGDVTGIGLVDPIAIARAGRPGVWSHLSPRA